MTRIFAAVDNAEGWRRRGLAAAGGAMAALAQAPFYALPLMVLGYCLLALLLDGVDASVDQAWRKRRAAASVGWWFGFAYFLIGLHWLAFSFLVQADQFAWMAPFGVVGLTGFLAVFTATACGLAISVWRPGPVRLLGLVACLSALDYARGHILTGLPWNLPGQSFAGHVVLAQSAAWIGVYGLGVVVLAIAVSPVAFIRPKTACGDGGGDDGDKDHDALSKGVGAGVVAFAAVAFVGAMRMALAAENPAPAAAVRIVQPNIPQREKIDPAYWGRNFERLVTLSSGPSPTQDGALFVIWPENAAPLLDESDDALRALDRSLPDDATLLAGAVRREWRKDANGADAVAYFNAMVAIATTPAGRKVVGRYDKHHLVPFGEYLPLKGLLTQLGLAQLAPYADGFAKGEGPSVLSVGGPSFSPLICYETIFPGAMHPKGERPDWLLTVTNDAWFGDSAGPRQHLDIARLRAIETGLPMARSANTGISALISAKGEYLALISLYKAGVVDYPLPPSLRKTLYSRLGDFAFYLFLLMSAGVVFAFRQYRP